MRRHRALLHWLAGRRNGESLMNTLKFSFDLPFVWKGRLKLEYSKDEGDYWLVKYQGLQWPLYWPKSLEIKFLHQVAAEILYPRNWWSYEINETSIGSEDVVVDCGAAEGMFTCSASQRAKKCIAVEPLPEFVECLRQSFSQVKNVEVIPKAVGKETRKIMLLNDGIMSSQTDSPGGLEVDMDTLDNMLLNNDPPISFIKADLEGHELDMLEGATALIKRCKPKLAITTYHFQNDAKQISEFIKDTLPEYNIRMVGIEDRFGVPVMCHAWI